MLVLLTSLLGILAFNPCFGAEDVYRATDEKLVCGNQTAIITSRCTFSGILRCLTQTMSIVEPSRSSSSQIDIRPVNIVRDTNYVLDGWACVRSNKGESYFLVDYVCTEGTPNCTEEDEKEQWQQLIDLHGNNFDAGHDLRQAGHELALQKAGLAHLMDPPGLQMRALKAITGK